MKTVAIKRQNLLFKHFIIYLQLFSMILETLKLSKCKQEIRYQPVIMIGLEFLFFCCLCRFLCAHFSVVLLYTLYLISLRTHAHIIAYVQTLDVHALKNVTILLYLCYRCYRLYKNTLRYNGKVVYHYNQIDKIFMLLDFFLFNTM